MNIGDIVLGAFIVSVPATAVGLLLIQLRRRRRFTYFQVIDEKTKAPLAGAEVFAIRTTRGEAHVASDANMFNTTGSGHTVVRGAAPAEEHYDRIGTLDANGSFRQVFSAVGTGALTIRGAGITAGLIGIESVSEYGSYPDQPRVCVLRMGVIAPPTKSSAMSRGLAPGEADSMREGYVEFYERPPVGEEPIAWPTLEEAKANSQSGSMARYWKVRGPYRGPGVGGNSFTIVVENVERIRGG